PWLTYNDAQVLHTTGSAACEEQQHSAYILFYKRNHPLAGGPHTPFKHTLHPAAFWKEVPEHPGPHYQTTEKFLPTSRQTPEHSVTALAHAHLHTRHYQALICSISHSYTYIQTP
ncbi:hypothetical protein Ciccas_013868, partial [Cichlidogyrus casuarinus]